MSKLEVWGGLTPVEVKCVKRGHFSAMFMLIKVQSDYVQFYSHMRCSQV